MPRRLRRSALVATALGAATAISVLPTSPADAGGAITQYGKVVKVDDGDTLEVDVEGDGTSSTKSIRLAGINAIEMTHYSSVPEEQRGECHAIPATRRLSQLVLGKRVKLTAQNSSSMSGSRYRRRAWVSISGTWRDVAPILLREGHGLFLSHGTEYANNLASATAAQQAAAKGIGLWDKDYCGSGPSQAAGLRLAVKWDASGDDYANVNGEWFRIANDSYSAVPIGGWYVRDSAYRGTRAHGYTFPSSAKIPARGAIEVHLGKGTNTATRFYWGLSEPIFENASGSPRYVGDGGYLFDPQGDLRASQQYPCRYAC